MNMNITEKIIVKENKILKLNNVLIREVSQNEFINIKKVAYMMESYIKSKGNSVVGPMINYSAAQGNENGQPTLILKLMLQLKNPICNIETPYEFKNHIRVTNCLFARFTENEEKLRYAYVKLELFAFENNLELKGDSYMVSVDKSNEKIVADVFMELTQGVDELENI